MVGCICDDTTSMEEVRESAAVDLLGGAFCSLPLPRLMLLLLMFMLLLLTIKLPLLRNDSFSHMSCNECAMASSCSRMRMIGGGDDGDAFG